MRAVKSTGNKSTELSVIKLLKQRKITGWRRKYKLFANPDFVFPDKKAVLFADGCFWHGHNCRNTKPKDNKDYWENKIKRNKKRDRLANKKLPEKGWAVFRIWECDIKKKRLPKSFLKIFQK